MDKYDRALLLAKITDKSAKTDSGCWEWQGRIEDTGYAITRFKTKRYYVHRASWIAHKGEIPKSKLILHTCDNRKCVNPAHLFLGTQKDNMRDMIAKGRKVVVKGEAHWISKVNDDQVRAIRLLADSGYRQCDIAEWMGLQKQRINDIVKRKNWKHI